MYIEFVPNRRSRPAVLLREGWREGAKVRKRTLANLTDWPAQKIEALRRLLKNEPLMAPDDVFEVERSLPHGHVEAVVGTMRKLGLDKILSARQCRERDLIVAMIAERLLAPRSKLGTIRMWHNTTLPEELGVEDASEDDLYEAMDWLLARQARIEKKLASRHLHDGVQVLYDVSTSYYEGSTCPLARFGHDRDKKKGKPIIVYGVLTDVDGRPIAVQVYPGNTGDPSTVPDQAQKLRDRFGLQQLVLVGDRGMLTQTQINTLKAHPGLNWISALRSPAIRKLVDEGSLQTSLFDERNLAEITSSEFPGERLMACYNPLLAQERARKRQELLKATDSELQRINREIARRTRTPLSDGDIGRKVGRVLNRFKVAKHFKVTIADGTLSFCRREDTVRRETELDGIYVIRTNEPANRLSAEDAVRSYKNLAHVERAFRCLKGIDLRIRPIHHHLERRVRAHIFLCTLAYYVEWHMRRALAPLLFHDEELDDLRRTRDAVLPARPSASAVQKKKTRTTPDGMPLHSFDTLLADLATRVRDRCRLRNDPNGASFLKVTRMTPLQQHAMTLLGLFPGARQKTA
jgi:transposase